MSEQDYTIPNVEPMVLMAKRWDIQEFKGPAFAGGSPQLLVPADPERWTLAMVWGSGGFFVLSNPPAGVTSWGLPATNAGVFLNYRDHGFLVCSAWSVWAGGVIPSTNPSAIACAWRTR